MHLTEKLVRILFESFQSIDYDPTNYKFKLLRS